VLCTLKNSFQASSKVALYRPILGDLAADPDHLAIFLVEAAMKLVKFIVQGTILNHYFTQIGGAIARYYAMGRPCLGAVFSPLHVLPKKAQVQTSWDYPFLAKFFEKL
jgi:hypothetical protein